MSKNFTCAFQLGNLTPSNLAFIFSNYKINIVKEMFNLLWNETLGCQSQDI